MSDAVRIAICGDVQVDGGDVRAVMEDCAREAGFERVEITRFASPIDLIDAIVHPAAPELFDLVVCGASMRGMGVLDVMRDAREAEFVPPMIALADDASQAYEALQVGISEFLVKPVEAEAFSSALERRLAKIVASEGDFITLRDGGITRRLPLSQVIWIETSGHDQVVHMVEGKSARVRKTSGDMFDMFSHDDRFFKVGSSSIINLDRVKFVRDGNKSIHMEDGCVVIAPVRIRKSIEETLLNRSIL